MKLASPPECFFSDEFLNCLLRDYQIDEQLKDSLHERLEHIAKKWYIQQNSPEEKVSPSDVKKALVGLSRDAHALKTRMENANDAVWSNLIGASSFNCSSGDYLGFEYATPHFSEIWRNRCACRYGFNFRPTSTFRYNRGRVNHFCTRSNSIPCCGCTRNLSTQKLERPKNQTIARMDERYAQRMARHYPTEIHT